MECFVPEKNDKDMEEKTKVVSFVGGQKLFNFLRRKLFCLGRFWIIGWIAPGWVKEKDEFIIFFKIVLDKTDTAAIFWINSSPRTEATTFAFSSVFILLICIYRQFAIQRYQSFWAILLTYVAPIYWKYLLGDPAGLLSNQRLKFAGYLWCEYFRYNFRPLRYGTK